MTKTSSEPVLDTADAVVAMLHRVCEASGNLPLRESTKLRLALKRAYRQSMYGEPTKDGLDWNLNAGRLAQVLYEEMTGDPLD